MDVKTMQDNLEEQIGLARYNVDELKYLKKSSVAKAIYTHKPKKTGRPRKNEDEKTKWNDRIECTICGKTYIRSGATKHRRTEFHQAFEKMDEKLRNLTLEDGKIESKNKKKRVILE